MSLHQTILADMNAAMKSRDAETLGVLRMLKAAFLNVEKSSAEASAELDDAAVLGVLQKEAKKRKESAAAFTAGGRDDLAAQENLELAIIEKYLPAEMTDDALLVIVNEVLGDGPADMSQFGALMGQVMQKVAGGADGNRVRAVLQKRLQQ